MNNLSSTKNTSVANIWRDFDDVFRDFYRKPMNIANLKNANAWPNPAINIYEKEDTYNIEVEVPGVTPEEIDVSLEGNVLTIKGEKTENKEYQEGECYHSERHFGSFKRSVQLPDYVDFESIKANQNHGVLTLTAHKVKDKGVKKISVNKC
ncbi:MAG: Hsp20/alpha crystallin family protein [Proteobacteria bacterium]|nr:Hsp20/alpha crystallin family protein [Pseudomonadota bacterium]